MDIAVHACKLNTTEVDEGGSWVWDQPWLLSEIYLKKTNKTEKGELAGEEPC